jgi:hypothetical protein
MSETTEGAPAPEPTPTPSTGPSGAPESTPATDAPEQTPEQQQEAREREDRRVAQLRARLGAAERERDRQATELEFYRRQVQQPQPGTPETPEQAAARMRAEVRAEVETQIRTERFHEQGASQFSDWKQRCDDLMSMGADHGFAQLLVEMPDGVKVTAALAADPNEVQRIANIRSERGRAIALGKYAAGLEDAPVRAAAANGAVSRAPAPIRPVTGRAAPTFNEYTADAQALVDRYMKQNLERQMRR